MSKSLTEALKRGARVLILAIVSYLGTTGVLAGLVAWFTGNSMDIKTQAEVTTVLTTLLTILDSYLHESGVAEKGLTRF